MTRLLLRAPLSLADVHDAVASHPGIPSHYGRNLDALADVLGDLKDVVVVWRGVRQSMEAMGEDAVRLSDVLGTATVNNPALYVAYVW